MSNSGKVVLGESVDKLMIQSEINSFQDQVSAHWKEYAEFFKGTNQRLVQSFENWIDKFFEAWDLRSVAWPFEVEDVENGVQISGNRCHSESFGLRFRNTDTYIDIELTFDELSFEKGLEAFEELRFDSLNMNLVIHRLSDEWDFNKITHDSKVNEFLAFLEKNFDYFKSLLKAEFDRVNNKCVLYSNEVLSMLDRYNQQKQALEDLETKERIKEFFEACEKEVVFHIPRRLRISSKTTIIAKAIRIQRIHSNHKYVAIDVKELELGLEEKVSYRTKSYEKVFIKTLFGFDLTQRENFKLLSNDF